MPEHLHYRNPVLPGSQADPSICRVGTDYYLVTSTFEYFPGIALHHSRDLVHWQQIGNVLDRPGQLDLTGVHPSGGIYAPTIRHHADRWYVVCTLASAPRTFRHFVVTADDVRGPWSDPVWLDDAPGIDPSLLFDGDRVWFTANRTPPGGEEFDGQREIWLQEFDPEKLALVGPVTRLWSGLGGRHAESPHLYRVGDHYHLVIAEGGTRWHHAVTVARSPSPRGPWTPGPDNPVVTNRAARRADAEITNVGHADLVQTPAGDWWMVLLGSRPYRPGAPGATERAPVRLLGRETFLVPVTWRDGWPVVGRNGTVEAEYPVPDLPPVRWPRWPACEHFDNDHIATFWLHLRTPRPDAWTLAERPGHLRLRLHAAGITEESNPTFVGRRVADPDFGVRTVLDFAPERDGETAGLVLLQDGAFHVRLMVTRRDGVRRVDLVRRSAGVDEEIGSIPLAGPRTFLRLEAYGERITFWATDRPGRWHTLATDLDCSLLSTDVAGGHTGTVVGLHASGGGADSTTPADVDWFEYVAL